MTNDTQAHDELLERVAELADQFACGAAGEPVVYALHGPTDFAEEVIAVVRRAAWQEFEAAMLSDDAVKAAGAVLIDRWDDDRLRNEWELVEKMTEAALQATDAGPEPGLDEAIAELRSLVFGKRKKVFALLEMNERHALQGEHRVLWPDAILGLNAKSIADAVRQVKGTEGSE